MSSTTLSPINQFLVSNDLRISDNPCISPDFCLDWDELKISIRSDDYKKHSRSGFKTSHGQWCLLENSKGDHAWELTGTNELSNLSHLSEGIEEQGNLYFPATYSNLIGMKNLMMEHDSSCSVFPRTSEQLGLSLIHI